MATFTWFLASPIERLDALPGWRIAVATGPRISRRVTNPFTHEEELQWSYPRELLGDDQDADADYPEVGALPQLGGRLSPEDFADLLQALNGTPASQTLDLLLSLRASGPPDAQCEVLRVHAELLAPLAGEVRDPEIVAAMWAAAMDAREPLGDAHSPGLARAFHRLRELAREAASSEREMFLLWCF